MQFGKRVKELRLQKGLTLRELADKVGLNFTYLSKIENGKVGYTPSAEKIRAIAEVLKADHIELLKLANKVPPELGQLADDVNAMTFLRKARDFASPEDWKDLLDYLDRKHLEDKKTKGGG
jgi:transcriptional regulator with XRE-family HTH domain